MNRNRVGIQLASWPDGWPDTYNYYGEISQQTERCGFDHLFFGDHIFTYNPMPESLCALAYAAGATKTIELGTAVLILPLRDPAIAAKQLATIDRLSDGRLIAGIGLGGEVEQEWKALQVSSANRGRRTDEYLEIMRLLWAGDEMDFHGEFRSVSGVMGTPNPMRSGGPPVWIGGQGDLALRRASRFSGWCAYATSPRRVRVNVERIAAWREGRMDDFRVACVIFTHLNEDVDVARATLVDSLESRYRRDFTPYLDVFCAAGNAEVVQSRVDEYRAAGVTDIILLPLGRADYLHEQIGQLSHILRLDRPDAS